MIEFSTNSYTSQPVHTLFFPKKKKMVCSCLQKIHLSIFLKYEAPINLIIEISVLWDYFQSEHYFTLVILHIKL